jgi:hypothetical protein
MISKKQKLAIVEMGVYHVNKELGTQYSLSGYAPDYYNLTSPSGYGVDTIKSGKLEDIYNFLSGILHGVAVITNRMDEE